MFSTDTRILCADGHDNHLCVGMVGHCDVGLPHICECGMEWLDPDIGWSYHPIAGTLGAEVSLAS